MVDTIYTGQTPTTDDTGGVTTRSVGMRFQVSSNGFQITTARYWVPAAGLGATSLFYIWDLTGATRLVEVDLNVALPSPSLNAWNTFSLGTTVNPVTGRNYACGIFIDGASHYKFSSGQTLPVSSGGVVSADTALFHENATHDTAPDNVFPGGFFFSDVNVEPAAVVANAGNAAGTGTANAASALVAPNAGVATATSAALGATGTVKTNVGIAVAAGAALNAQVQTVVIANAGVASATGVALGSAGVSATTGAGVAGGIGRALDATVGQEGDVRLYKFGPCDPWVPIWPRGSCADILLDPAAPGVTGVAVQAASEILYQLTAQRFGTCLVKLRPCRRSCFGTWPWWTWWEYGTYPQPYWWNGTWYNLACNSCPSDSCSCVALEETVLPGPVVDVTEVKINGVALVRNVDYRLDDYRKLVRLGGQLWPFCQDMNLEDTQANTWSVTAQFGEVVPAIGQLAVGELGLEFVKALLCDDDCALPPNVVDVSRQGVSMTIAKISDLFNQGFVSLRFCDLFIQSANPKHLQARSAVYDLDGPQDRAVGTW